MLSLYIDSADRPEVEALMRTGAFSGATTNPKLLRAAGLGPRDLPSMYAWMLDAGARDVFMQSWGDNAEALYANGQQLLAIGDRAVVKVVASHAGITAASRLHAAGARVLLTAVYATHQAVTAGAIGLKFIAPYMGKLTEAGVDGRRAVVTMHEVLRATGSNTRVLAASLRSTADITHLAQQGVDAFAIPAPVAWKFFEDAYTQAAVNEFDEITSAWQ